MESINFGRKGGLGLPRGVWNFIAFLSDISLGATAQEEV